MSPQAIGSIASARALRARSAPPEVQREYRWLSIDDVRFCDRLLTA